MPTNGDMRTLCLASVCVAVATATLASGAALAKDARPVGPPKNLHGFLLKPTEPTTRVFPRTPAFAWAPVRGAQCYEFQLATSRSFSSNSVIWSNATDDAAAKPCQAVPADTGATTGTASDPTTDPRRHPARHVDHRSGRSDAAAAPSPGGLRRSRAALVHGQPLRALRAGSRSDEQRLDGLEQRLRVQHAVAEQAGSDAGRPRAWCAGAPSRARPAIRSGTRRSASRSRRTRTPPTSASCTSSTGTIRPGGRTSSGASARCAASRARSRTVSRPCPMDSGARRTSRSTRRSPPARSRSSRRSPTARRPGSTRRRTSSCRR